MGLLAFSSNIDYLIFTADTELCKAEMSLGIFCTDDLLFSLPQNPSSSCGMIFPDSPTWVPCMQQSVVGLLYDVKFFVQLLAAPIVYQTKTFIGQT